MSDPAAYVRLFALYLNELGPCPNAREHGLTYDQARACEKAALDLAFDESAFKGKTS